MYIIFEDVIGFKLVCRENYLVVVSSCVVMDIVDIG